MKKRIVRLLFSGALIAGRVMALGPHELAVVVNASSPDSRHIAEVYAQLRRVPAQNIVHVDLPPGKVCGRDISPGAFNAAIRDPVEQALRERGIAGHILGWAYSVDFPVRVSTSPPMSLTGMTFVKGALPTLDLIASGRFHSPLYAGPDRRVGRAHYSQSLDVSADWLRDDTPVPAIMLGITGERGNSLEEIKDCLARGTESDGTFPDGDVVFVDHSDVRSRVRKWQFRGAVEELRARNVSALVQNKLPEHGLPLVGLMAGEPNPKPSWSGPYRPGCIAEHLTSLAAVFESGSQTKLTEWIRAGVTVTCGAITEPRSIWMKFPTARVHVHQASGCTALESMYQSVRCPLQLLVVGEPLSAPWARVDAAISVRAPATVTAPGKLRVEARVSGPDARRFRRFLHLLDGRSVGRARLIWVDTKGLTPGEHTIRTVAYSTGFVRHQVFAERTVTVSGNTP